jgi:hypothetical protein
MKKIKWSLLLILLMCLFVYSPDGAVEAVDNNIPLNMQTIKVDGFEPDPERGDNWTVLYSRYRTRNWYIPVEARGDTNGQMQRYSFDMPRDPSREWWDYFPREGTDVNIDQVLPQGLPEEIKNNGVETHCLGVRGNWDFKGYNWIILQPSFSRLSPISTDAVPLALLTENGEPNLGSEEAQVRHAAVNYNDPRVYERPYYIELVGKTQYIDVWVWGAGYDYNLEIQLEDFRGQQYNLHVANLEYLGWRNVRVEIPSYIPQEQNYAPRIKPLKFLRFKIVANPMAREKNFYVYFDYMQALTDRYVEPFFGEKLQDVNSVWGSPGEQRRGQAGGQQ